MDKKLTLTDAIYAIMREGSWWTFWDLQLEQCL
mgnify:CR=1 FL=1